MTNQRERILELLMNHRGEWIPVYELSRIALQYNTRIHELRNNKKLVESGITIEEKEQWVGGSKHTWYRIPPVNEQMSLFAASAHRDPA